MFKYFHFSSYAGTTVAQENRFYDDKETYTGVHKAGGPTVVDRDKQGLDNLLDRSDADVRGLKKVYYNIIDNNNQI